MDWIDALDNEEVEAVLNSDMGLVYELCGIGVCKMLWQHLSGVNVYVSEKSLFELKRRYIRRFHDASDPRRNKKALAALLGCSEKFVQLALSTVEEASDPRQGELL